jgi:hypothetical protein
MEVHVDAGGHYMGRVSSKYAGLSTAQLDRIDVLARRLYEQTLARSVIVTFAEGSAIAKVGDVDPVTGATLKSVSEKVAGRLRVDVSFDDSTTLGLVRLRLKYFTEEVEKVVLTAHS